MSKDKNSSKKNNSGQKNGTWLGLVWKATLKKKAKSQLAKTKDENSPQKTDWGKKIRTWFSLVWKTYTTEVEDRVLSSPKRLIKFAGISIIPIIYGVICIVAFWNPIQNLGRAPMVIMDQDQAVVMVESTKENPTTTTSATNPYFFGPLAGITGVDIKTINTAMGYNNNDESQSIHQSSSGSWLIPNKLIDSKTKISQLEAKILEALNGQTNPQITLTTRDADGNPATFAYDQTNPTFGLKIMSGWTMAKSVLQPSQNDESDLNHTFKSNKINGTYQLTNIKYLNDQKEIDHQWHGTKYYVQMKIPDGFIEKVLTYLGTMVAKNPPSTTYDDQGNPTTIDPDAAFLAELVQGMNPLDVWTTFERNFIFGYYFTTISNVIDGVLIKAIPTILNDGLMNNSGAKFSYNGATIKTLIGSTSDEDVLWDIEGSTTKKVLEDATTYIMPDASKLPTTTNENIRNYTVFGNIQAGLKDDDDGKVVDPSATADQVGGKFINLLQTVLNTASNSSLLTKILAIANALGIGGDAQSIITLLNNVIAVIKGVLGNAPINTALITLNYETYQVATGDKSLASTQYLSKIVSILWKQVTGTEINYNNFKTSPIFTTHAIMTNNQFVANLNTNIKNNSAYLLGATSVNELMPRLVAQLLAAKSYGMTNQKLTSLTIQGAKHGLYGIGLGQFFLLIGLYVGSLLQSFIFDRAKRTKKATATSWYLGKWMLFATVAIVQSTLVSWVAYAVGWHQVGGVTMIYIWLWLMFSVLIFMTIIQGIWFLIEDEAVGRFCCVIVLVLSLAAGGGTFPAISQFAFFHAISYVVPFTYVLKGLGAIVYGVSGSGTTALTTNYIFAQLGILLIYFVLFMTLGLGVGSRLLMRQMNWGSQRGKVVVQAMKNLGRDEAVAVFATKKNNHQRWMGKHERIRYKYHWNTLTPDFDEELYFACRNIRLDDGFKWWKLKDHDFVQKPNYSDEESITRNE